jgi:hypothetical protein
LRDIGARRGQLIRLRESLRVAEELSRDVALGEGLMLEWCRFLGGVDRRFDEVVTLV